MNLKIIIDALSEQGFAHILDISQWISPAYISEKRFCAWWERLVHDENFRLYTHRERRILRYFASGSGNCAMQLNPSTDFVSGATYAVPYQRGTNALTYAEEGFITDRLLQQILHFDLAVSRATSPLSESMDIDIHQFRIKATSGQSKPTTSGIHQDGYDLVFMHFINKHNAFPVISEVFDRAEEAGLQLRKELGQFMETLIVDDRRCWHRASALRQKDLRKPAYRDVLIVSFRYQGKGTIS